MKSKSAAVNRARQFALIIGNSSCANETRLASQIVDCRYALSEQVSLPGAARGLPAWEAKIAIGWSRRAFAFTGLLLNMRKIRVDSDNKR
jgi:hypothetical protein